MDWQGGEHPGMAVPLSSFKINSAVHQALLREVRRLRAAVVGVDLADPSALAGLHLRWEFFAAQLADHHENEDTYLWPPAEAAATAEERVVLVAMTAEHEAVEDAVTGLSQAMADLSTDADRDVALARWDELELVLTGHCLHEEQAAVPILAKYLTESDMQQLWLSVRSQQNFDIALAWICEGAPQGVVTETWRLLPAPLRLLAKPRATRKYRAFTQECGV